jgi:hypothetical protein
MKSLFVGTGATFVKYTTIMIVELVVTSGLGSSFD